MPKAPHRKCAAAAEPLAPSRHKRDDARDFGGDFR